MWPDMAPECMGRLTAPGSRAFDGDKPLVWWLNRRQFYWKGVRPQGELTGFHGRAITARRSLVGLGEEPIRNAAEVALRLCFGSLVTLVRTPPAWGRSRARAQHGGVSDMRHAAFSDRNIQREGYIANGGVPHA